MTELEISTAISLIVASSRVAISKPVSKKPAFENVLTVLNKAINSFLPASPVKLKSSGISMVTVPILFRSSSKIRGTLWVIILESEMDCAKSSIG